MRKTGVILAPIVSEKSFRLAAVNQYTFVVANTATSSDVVHALRELFKVTPLSVRTLNITGKLTRYRNRAGQRNSWKRPCECPHPTETPP